MSFHQLSRSADLDTLQEYTFERLPTRQHLRILQVQPEFDNVATISCFLEPQLDAKSNRHGFSEQETDKHGYEALSWCWGQGSNEQSIRILDRDGGKEARHFQISEHLYEALRALRHRDRPRYLWIDRICVNQSNVKERNQQVARMNEIYGDARNVCIWLGKGTEQTKEAFEFVKDQVLDLHSFDDLLTDPEHISKWVAMLEVMKANWFNRRWVVQEVSLARSASVYCGAEYVDWERFGAAVSLFVDAESSTQQLAELARKREDLGLHKIDNFFKELPFLGATRLVNTTSRLFKKSVGSVPQQTSPLEDIVAHLAMFESSEPRDTVYALLALAKDSQPSVDGLPDYLNSEELTPKQKKALTTLARLLPNPLRQKYPVDYEQRVVDVYQQFIAFAISKADPTRALDIICRPFAQPVTKKQDVSHDPDAVAKLAETEKERIIELPSWITSRDEVPWGKTMRRRKSGAVPRMERQRGDAFISTPDSVSYSAAGSKAVDKRKIRFRKQDKDYSMFVEGFVLDTVGAVEARASRGDVPAEWFHRAKSHFERQHDPDAFWKTLVADRSPRGPAPRYYKNAIEAAFEDAGKVTFDVQGSIREDGSSAIISEVLRHVQDTIWERSLIETKRGFLGLGPKTVKKNDLVCILYGCTVPIILRRVRKTKAQNEQDAEHDEADKSKREERVKLLLKSIWQRKHAQQKRAKAQAMVQIPTQARIVAWTNKFLQRPVRRTALLMIIFLAVIYFSKDRFAASLLALLAFPHLLSEVSYQPFSIGLAPWRQLDEQAVIVISMLFMAMGVVMAVAQTHLAIAVGLLAVFNSIFHEVLPGPFSKWYVGLLTATADRIACFIENIVGPNKQITTEEGGTPSTDDSGPGAAPVDEPTTKKILVGLKGPTDEPLLPYYYQVIGESYIHKMMNGEAIEWQNEKAFAGVEGPVEGKPEIFELR